MCYHFSDVIHLWIQLVASMVIFYKNGDLTIFLQDRHDAHMVWTISSNLFFAKTIINHPPTSHLTFFPPHNSNSTLQTCRGQWEVVRGWELGWISKTQRRWTLFGNWLNGWLRVWTLGFILVFFQVKEYLENLGVEYRFENKYLPTSAKDYRFGCYHEKDPAACHLLGDYWEGIKKDFIKVSPPRPTVFLHWQFSRPWGSTPQTAMNINMHTAVTR